jgi:diguanylate cyclase (GGDEF)-like protein/PAS domain S-box-containing protein
VNLFLLNDQKEGKNMKPSSLKQVKTKEKALEKKSHLSESILERIDDPFFILDQKGGILKANPKGIEMMGYPWEELQEMSFIDRIAPEDQERISNGFTEMGQGKEIRLKVHLIHQGGEQIPAEFIGTLKDELLFVTLQDLREKIKIEEEWEKTKRELMEKVRERDQYARELQAMKDAYKEKLKEIEKKAKELEEMREELTRLSYTDDLTGIYNHRFFVQQLTREVDRQRRYPTQLSLLMIDIDYFKDYNDTNGHLAGDKVLKAISLIIQHAVRQTDFVARYGGEEFCAILINTGREGAFAIAERVRRMVAEMPFPNENAQPNGDLTVSVGIATFSPNLTTVTDLIREADNALYRAKRAGRNRIEG